MNNNYDSAFVAFIDIMGFKDLVENNSHEELQIKFEKLFSSIVRMSLSYSKYKVIDEQGIKQLIPDTSKIIINSLIISDSVIFWTNNDSMKSFVDISVVVRNLLSNAVFTGFPLRGAISMGPISVYRNDLSSAMDNSQQTIIGRGIVNAYKLEMTQNWLGCVVDESCIATYRGYYDKYLNQNSDLASIEYLIQQGLLAKYKTPYKTGKVKSDFVINWVSGNEEPPSEDLIRSCFSAHNKTADNWSVESKILNTIQFRNSIIKRI